MRSAKGILSFVSLWVSALVFAAPAPSAPAAIQSSLQKIQGACHKGGLKSLDRIYFQERKKILERASALGEKGIDEELERESAKKGLRPLVSALTEITPEALPADHPMKDELTAHEKELEKALTGSREAARNWALKTRSLYVEDRPMTTQAILNCVEKSYGLKLED